MYVPRTFEETDPRVMQQFVARNRLATLISLTDGALCADHIPMLAAATDDGRYLLQGHVARANPLWRNISAGTEVLAVFLDPGIYITPSWYASKAETQKVVPTWNYIAVHAYGIARTIAHSDWLRAFLGRLTAANESARPLPWRISDAPARYIETQLEAIVGIEIAVSRWVGKWKVSQNRLPKDVDGVIDGLRAAGDPVSARMADEAQSRRPS